MNRNISNQSAALAAYRWRATIAFLSLAFATSCQPPNRAPTAPEDGELDPELAAAKEKVLADTCFRDADDLSQCEWMDVAHSAQDFAMNENTGETILVVEPFDTAPLIMLRYRNRLKGVYRVADDASVQSVDVSWRVPKVLGEVLGSLARPDYVPAETYAALYAPIHETYDRYLTSVLPGHVGVVLSLILENNPLQPIALLDVRGPIHERDLCVDDSASLERLRATATKTAQDIAVMMRQHHVRFVNASFGATFDGFKAFVEDRCGTNRINDEVARAKFLAMNEPLYSALFGTHGVFAAHAAIDATDEYNYPFDFPSPAYPNRLRVGYLASTDSGLDELGRGEHQSLHRWPEPQNVDVLMNSGLQRRGEYGETPFLDVDEFGVSVGPITLNSTSGITPLALADFIYHRYSSHSDEEMSDALIEVIKNEMVPTACPSLPEQRCIYQDPLRHGHIEAVRLGHRPREYSAP